MAIEEEDEDVLQNLEFGIIQVYRQNRALLDADVSDALEALIHWYRSEQGPRSPRRFRFDQRTQDVFDSVKADLPGIDPKDVNVSLLGTQLTIEGERKIEGRSRGRVHVPRAALWEVYAGLDPA